MITTSTATFEIEDGSQQRFDGASIICEPTYNELTQTFYVRLNVVDITTTTVIAYGSLQLTKTQVDAQTGTGSGETAPWFNALQKAVISELSGYTNNGSTVFTIV